MTKLTSNRWAMIFFISLIINIFLGSLIISDKYFKDTHFHKFRGIVYTVPWAHRVLGDEVQPLTRQIFRNYNKKLRDMRQTRSKLYKNTASVLTQEPFDKNLFKSKLVALKDNSHLILTEMSSMMSELSAQLTITQRKKLAFAAKRILGNRHQRSERRRKRREKRLKDE